MNFNASLTKRGYSLLGRARQTKCSIGRSVPFLTQKHSVILWED